MHFIQVLKVALSANIIYFPNCDPFIVALYCGTGKPSSVIRRCQTILPRSCKEMDYGDIIYDPCLKSESDAIEKFQRKAALACSGAFRITSNERLLNELGWEKNGNP